MGAPRSTLYARSKTQGSDPSGVVVPLAKRGPRTEHTDDELRAAIKEVISSSLCGEGHRKVTARLRRERASVWAASGFCASCEPTGF